MVRQPVPSERMQSDQSADLGEPGRNLDPPVAVSHPLSRQQNVATPTGTWCEDAWLVCHIAHPRSPGAWAAGSALHGDPGGRARLPRPAAPATAPKALGIDRQLPRYPETEHPLRPAQVAPDGVDGADQVHELDQVGRNGLGQCHGVSPRSGPAAAVGGRPGGDGALHPARSSSRGSAAGGGQLAGDVHGRAGGDEFGGVVATACRPGSRTPWWRRPSPSR